MRTFRASGLAAVAPAAAIWCVAGSARAGENDECVNAEPIEVGQTVTGDTGTATFDDAPNCGLGPSFDPGRWHKAIGDGTTYTAATCGSSFDTRLSVYCQGCDSLACAADEDFGLSCFPNQEVSWCTQEGFEYFILVHGDGDFGVYQLALTSDGKICEDPPMECAPPPPCDGDPVVQPGIVNQASLSGIEPQGMTQDPNTGLIYVADMDLEITDVYDPDLTHQGTIPSAGTTATRGVTYDTVNGTLWFLDNAAKELVESDLTGTRTGSVIELPGTQHNIGGVEYDATTDTFWYVDITDDDLIQVNRAGTALAIFDQTCVDQGQLLLGTALDVLDGQLEVLVGIFLITPAADRIIPVDPSQEQSTQGSIGTTPVTNGPVLGLSAIVDGQAGSPTEFMRNRLNPGGSIFVASQNNGILYEIALCVGDTDGSGVVDVQDLTNVILDWGTDGSAHGGDVNGDGTVDVADLTEVILAWGPCA